VEYGKKRRKSRSRGEENVGLSSQKKRGYCVGKRGSKSRRRERKEREKKNERGEKKVERAPKWRKGDAKEGKKNFAMMQITLACYAI
jgi:hypothetical protein